jgi:hypothetical protein
MAAGDIAVGGAVIITFVIITTFQLCMCSGWGGGDRDHTSSSIF